MSRISRSYVVCLCYLLLVLCGDVLGEHEGIDLARKMFPEGFLFGTATAAYQVEGAAFEDGKLNSTWDTFAHTPGAIQDNSTGDVAVDHYHRYKEDIDLMHDMGMNAYRFSIAWPRIFPKGSPRFGPVNEAGLKHYNDVINYLLEKKITPLVTLFHWDTPQLLQDEYKGWLYKPIVDDFVAYANVCFANFGDRVKMWATINEPYIFSQMSYDMGFHAPGYCSWRENCLPGNSTRDPYWVAHNVLLAHSTVVKLYKDQYQSWQHGTIGIVMVTPWLVPFFRGGIHANILQRALDFQIGWFMDPITKGDYPEVMKEYVGERLPKFTKQESENLKHSFDWIGMNYYSTQYVFDYPDPPSNTNALHDSHVLLTYEVKGGLAGNISMGEKEGTDMFRSYPPGLRSILNYFKDRYDNPAMYITETGYVDENNESIPIEEALDDTARVKYHKEHLNQTLWAIRDGANVKGYIVWSFIDNFEWSEGYASRFGLVHVDYKNNLKRRLKASAKWFKDFLKH